MSHLYRRYNPPYVPQYVVSKTYANNRRSIRVKPTAAGMAIKEPVQKRIEELNDMVFKEFTPQEREEVLNLLTRIGKVCADDLKEGK